MTHIDHKINPLDKRQKKIQLGDLKKQFHTKDLNILYQTNVQIRNEQARKEAHDRVQAPG